MYSTFLAVLFLNETLSPGNWIGLVSLVFGVTLVQWSSRSGRSESKKGFQISLLLSMDRLGDIRTDFFLLENDLTMTFFVDRPSTKSIIQDNYSVLHDLLHSFFDQVNLNVLISEKKVKDFDHENVSIAGDKRVDLRI